MATSEYKARQVRAKTSEVYEYDHDDEKPGKPLHILIPGGLIALATLALIVFIAYLTWFDGSLAESTGTVLCLILAPFYVGGVFLFSYGYELYNIPRALRLTAIIVFVTLAAVVIVAVLFLVLGNMKGGGSSSSNKSSSRSKSGSSKSSGPSAQGVFGGMVAGGMSKNSSSGSGGSSSSGGHYHSGGPIFIGGGGTRVETREVTKEIIKEVPKEPMPIECPFCKRSYIPVEHNFVCPSCGAATPQNLIEESQMPEEDLNK
ncbi:MAG: TFIIB-type zinc ribbon-containing protein [Chloroflexota bacterium]